MPLPLTSNRSKRAQSALNLQETKAQAPSPWGALPAAKKVSPQFVAIMRSTTFRCFEPPLPWHASPATLLLWGPAQPGSSQDMEDSRSPGHGS